MKTLAIIVVATFWLANVIRILNAIKNNDPNIWYVNF